ncbi:MAG: hypothetical protein ACP5O3_04645, partial [Candidatus Micrarchaeia archaeon]
MVGKNFFQKQTLNSFDYQWSNLSEGYALLTDKYFFENVDKIIAEQELCINPLWFKGKKIL